MLKRKIDQLLKIRSSKIDTQTTVHGKFIFIKAPMKFNVEKRRLYCLLYCTRSPGYLWKDVTTSISLNIQN